MGCLLVSQVQSIVAVLDDEPQMRKALRRLLATHGFKVDDYGCATKFMAARVTHPADCLMSRPRSIPRPLLQSLVWILLLDAPCISRS